MKTKVTARFVRESFPRVIEVGYCGIWNLLSCENPRWYTCGIYGWNADIYMVDSDTVIVTGYRPFGKYNGNPLSRKYEEMAKEVSDKYRWSGKYEEERAELRNLIAEFVKEVCGDAED